MTSQPHKDNATRPTHHVSPFPGLGGLYLLIAGIILGVLLGPAVLGRLAPSIYEDAFVGGTQQRQELFENKTQIEAQAQTLLEIGVTDAAIPEHLLQIKQQEIAWRVAIQQHLNTLVGWTTALMLAVIAVMMLESLMSPDTQAKNTFEVSPALGRLATARYALSALWIAIMLAQPKLLTQLPIAFAGLLVLVSLAAALVPLGPKTSRHS
jgi:hypothetical protein